MGDITHELVVFLFVTTEIQKVKVLLIVLSKIEILCNMLSATAILLLAGLTRLLTEIQRRDSMFGKV